MEREQSRSNQAQFILHVVIFALVFASLLFRFDNGSHPDEATYLGISDEMSLAHVLTPTREGVPAFFKPPLLYWVQASCLALFGRHLWAARLPSLLSTMALGFAVFFVLRRIYRARARHALMAMSFVWSSFGVLRFGVLGMNDALFSLALFATFAFAVAARKVPRRLYGSALSMAIAILLKGPIGLALGGGLTAIALLRRRRRPLPWVTLALAGVVMSGLALPWFLIEWNAYGQEFVDKFFLVEHMGKVTGHRSVGGELLLVALGFITAAPWLPLGRKPGRSAMSSWGLAVLFIVATYALQTSRQLHYGLPCVPFVAMLCAHRGPSLRMRRAFRLLAVIPVGLSCAALFAGANPVGVLALGCSALLALFVWAISTGRALVAASSVSLCWAFIFGVWAPLSLPPAWPAELSRFAKGERVSSSSDEVGVARFDSHVDLHRTFHSVAEGASGELWVHRLRERPDVPHLWEWSRLRNQVSAAELWDVIRTGDVASLTERWALSRIP